MRYCLFILLILAGLATAARAETYQNSEHAFSIQLPEGWTLMTPEAVAEASEAYSPDIQLHSFAGFEDGQCVVLITSDPYPDADTYQSITVHQIEQLAALLTQAKANELHSATRPSSPSMGAGTVKQVTCFKDPPGFILDGLAPRSGNRSHAVAFLGKNQIVYLNFYLNASAYGEQRDAINQIAGSFQFDRKQALSTQTTFRDPTDNVRWGIYLFVGLLIFASVCIVYYLFRRKAY